MRGPVGGWRQCWVAVGTVLVAMSHLVGTDCNLRSLPADSAPSWIVVAMVLVASVLAACLLLAGCFALLWSIYKGTKYTFSPGNTLPQHLKEVGGGGRELRPESFSLRRPLLLPGTCAQPRPGPKGGAAVIPGASPPGGRALSDLPCLSPRSGSEGADAQRQEGGAEGNQEAERENPRLRATGQLGAGMGVSRGH